MQRIGAIACVLFLVTAAVPLSAPAAASTSTSQDETIEVTYHLDSVESGTARITATVKTPPSLMKFVFHTDSRIVESDGFSHEGDKVVWDGETTNPSVTFEVKLAEACPPDGFDACISPHPTPGLVDVGAMTPKFYYAYRGTSVSHAIQYEAENGTVHGPFVTVGNYQTTTENAGETAVRFVYLPDSPNQDEAIAAVTAAAERFDVGGKDQLTIISAPERIRDGGLERDGTAWVDESMRVNSVSNPWVHEYVHTRQPGEQYGDEMQWFVEGSASYYGALLTLKQGRVTYGSFHRYISTAEHSDVVLTDKTDRSMPSHYTKGRRVLAALDAEIRRSSNGTASLQTVMTMMNDHEGTIDYADFQNMVERAAGENKDEWLDRYLRSSAVPTPPRSPHAYTAPTGDPDEDSLPNSREEELGTSPFSADTDGDLIPDRQEVALGQSPTSVDSDGDGAIDTIDVCPKEGCFAAGNITSDR